jgi:DNA-binding NarL/FixJ family response regulator
VRVMLADDGVLFREGMARILTEIGFQVTGQTGDGATLVDLVRRDPPDVALLDLRMPPRFADEGIEAAGAIRSTVPGVGLMLLSQYVEVHHGTVIDPELVSRLVARRRERDPLGELTDRERAVLALMARGHSNGAVAADLHLAVKTVEAHVTSIFTKLGLSPGDREHRRVLAVLRFLRA